MNIVEQKLMTLHEDAKKDYLKVGKGIIKSIFRPMQPQDFEHAYLPVSREQGELLRKMVVDNKSKNVVEFGTSFGISTLYLADAVRQTGGTVITTELLESKAEKAKLNIQEAGLGAYVELRIGDAMQTLKNLSTPVDFLFLDGWKDLYLPLFKMLAPFFHAKTLIYADNMDMAGTKEYAQFLSFNNNTYRTQSIDDGRATITQLI